MMPPCFSLFTGLPMDAIVAIRAGVPAGIVGEVAEFLRLRHETLTEYLRLDDASVHDRAARRDALLPWEASRVYLVFKVYERIFAMCQHEEGAIEWLGLRIPALGNVTVLSLLDTPAGFDLVLCTLSQMESGAYL